MFLMPTYSFKKSLISASLTVSCLALAGFSQATHYPVTVTSCDREVTFTQAPKKPSLMTSI